MTDTNSDLRTAVLSALEAIQSSDTGESLVKSGQLQGLTVKQDGAVGFIIETRDGSSPEAEAVRKAAEEAVSAVPGVSRVTAVLTAHQDTTSGKTRMRKGDNVAENDAKKPVKPAAQRPSLPGVKSVIAIASAKGGVGKSSVTVNLAVTCAQLGLRVGLLDADVYGPSIPTMLGTVKASPKQKNGMLIPVEAHGVKTMSIGYLADQDAPMVWRGAIVVSAINQMLNDVDWGDLDVLFIDTPPGTGDTQLTLVQRAPLTGAIIVSTPQEIALADVRRGVAMFRKTHTPIIGIVENMAWFEDPVSGQRSYIFGQGGAERTAKDLDAPFLGHAPILTDIREGGDKGEPAVVASAPSRDIFRPLAEKVIASLESPLKKPAPRIIFE